jgi:hypothetical protein
MGGGPLGSRQRRRRIADSARHTQFEALQLALQLTRRGHCAEDSGSSPGVESPHGRPAIARCISEPLTIIGHRPVPWAVKGQSV